MNACSLRSLAIASLLLAAAPALAQVQTGGRFTLEAMATPGGALRGGRFELHGTVNPSAAGAATNTPATPSGNSRYQLTAGNLAPFVVIQQPDAPELRIALLPGGRIELSWVPGDVKVRLQGTTDPVNGPWNDMNPSLNDTPSGVATYFQADEPMRYFRLKR